MPLPKPLCVVLALLLNGVLYAVMGVHYQTLVLWLTGYTVSWLIQTPISFAADPQNGFWLMSQTIDSPILFRFSLASLFLSTALIAPLVVLMTAAPIRRLWAQLFTAFAVLTVCHCLHLMALVMHFLSQANHPLIPLLLHPLLQTPARWAYELADQGGFVLFPLIAVLVATHPRPAREMASPDRQ